MNDVICPASKGTLSMKACLDCALTWENPCQYSHAMLQAMFEKPKRTGIHVTDLTGCLRKAYYEKTQPMPVLVHSLLVMFAGTSLHTSFEKNGDGLSQSEVPVECEGVVGKVDRLYHNGILVDFKSTRWLIPSRLPYGSHELQLQIYAHMLEQMGQPVTRAFIQYVDVSGPTKCTAGTKWAKCSALVVLRDGLYVCPKCGRDYPEGHLGAWRVEVDLSRPIESMLQKSRDALVTALETKVPPYPEVGWLCGNCQYIDICDAAKGG